MPTTAFPPHRSLIELQDPEDLPVACFDDPDPVQTRESNGSRNTFGHCGMRLSCLVDGVEVAYVFTREPRDAARSFRQTFPTCTFGVLADHNVRNFRTQLRIEF